MGNTISDPFLGSAPLCIYQCLRPGSLSLTEIDMGTMQPDKRGYRK